MNEAHAHWRARVRDFVSREIEPNLDAWEVAGTFPDALYESAARQGLLGVGFPERLGGNTEDADPYYRVIFAEEMHRPGSGVVFADLATHCIALPPVVQFGSEELQETIARPVLAGKRRSHSRSPNRPAAPMPAPCRRAPSGVTTTGSSTARRR